LWHKDGFKEDSVRFGGKHLPLDFFGPFAPLPKAMARYQTLASNVDMEADDEGEKTITDAALDLTLAVADTALSEHWMENLADLVSAIDAARREDSIRPLEIYGVKVAAGFIPNVVRAQVTKRIDEGVKDIASPLDAFISKVPVWSKKVSNKVDLWGDDMTYNHFLDPSVASKITGKDPVAVEMRRIGLKLPDVRRTQLDVKMTPEEFHQYMVYSGKGVYGLPPLRDELTSRITSPLYRKFATDIGRQEYLKDAIHMYREAARQAMKNDNRFSFGKRVDILQMQKQEAMRINQ
jgi:hypothetical protein